MLGGPPFGTAPTIIYDYLCEKSCIILDKILKCIYNE